MTLADPPSRFEGRADAAPPDAALPAAPPAARASVLVGLVGSGIAASRTPALHEREGAAQGLAYVYKLIDVDAPGFAPASLPELLAFAKRFGFAGLNVTHPFKQAVLPLLDELSPDAAAIGAVNTVVLRDGRATGHNTDASGFAESFRREWPDAPRDRAVLLGAGGAGAAVAHALLALGVGRLEIADAEPARAEALATALCARFGAGRAAPCADLAGAVAAADGIVNATPVGMAKYPGLPLDAALLRPTLWVADIVYFPLETALLARARALGCRTLGGGGMAVFQAVGAFRLFTGLEPDANRMLRHFAALG